MHQQIWTNVTPLPLQTNISAWDMNDQHIKTDLAQQLETPTHFQQMFHLRFSDVFRGI